MTNFVFQLEDIDFKREDAYIFRNLNLQIPANKLVAIMGPSGCGKSTLLRLLNGLLKPNKGQVIFYDKQGRTHNVSSASKKQLYVMRKDMGMLFQNNALLTDLSIAENVAFPIKHNSKIKESEIKKTVQAKLAAVGLAEASELMPSELSGGMLRRAALARAIALNPSTIFYDEPFTGQDPINLQAILKLIVKLNKDLKISSLVVTHDLEEIFTVADYGVILAEQNVLIADSMAKIKTSPNTKVQNFLKGVLSN